MFVSIKVRRLKYCFCVTSFKHNLFSVLFPVKNVRSFEKLHSGPEFNVSRSFILSTWTTRTPSPVTWTTLTGRKYPPDENIRRTKIFAGRQILLDEFPTLKSDQVHRLKASFCDVLKHILKTYPASVLQRRVFTVFPQRLEPRGGNICKTRPENYLLSFGLNWFFPLMSWYTSQETVPFVFNIFSTRVGKYRKTIVVTIIVNLSFICQ